MTIRPLFFKQAARPEFQGACYYDMRDGVDLASNLVSIAVVEERSKSAHFPTITVGVYESEDYDDPAYTLDVGTSSADMKQVVAAIAILPVVTGADLIDMGFTKW